MRSIDVLGEEYSLERNFTKELLSEAEDDELQEIVEQAAKELKSPIALVSLILDQIQFFKAHTGLPAQLKKSRGTLRNASFCQFVVKDGLTFEVNDGPNDPRIPQYVVEEFNIKAYLGVPIKLGDAVVGSLCVLDTEKRQFTDAERNKLTELSKLVNLRLSELTEKRRRVRLDLTHNALPFILKELEQAQLPIQEHLKTTFSNLANVRFFLNKLNHTLSNSSYENPVEREELEMAINSGLELQGHLGEMEMDIWNSLDCLNALQKLVKDLGKSTLSEVLEAAQDISRNATDKIGGFNLPNIEPNPRLHTNSSLAMALVSNCILLIAKELEENELKVGINLEIQQDQEVVSLHFHAEKLKLKAYQVIYDQLCLYLGNDHPTVEVILEAEKISIKMKTYASDN